MRRQSLLSLLFFSAILLAACENGHGLTGGPTGPVAPVEPVTTRVSTVTGTVISAVSGHRIAGAIVSIGPATATTGPDGRFALLALSPGPATLRCIADGFEDFEADITVPSGGMTRTISLTAVGPLLIHADVRPNDISVTVYQGGTWVTDALVTVNGTTIRPASRREAGRYQGGNPVYAGLPLELEVTAYGKTVKATATMPETPVLTAPTPGSVFAHTDSIIFAWTTSSDPDSFGVLVGFGMGTEYSVPGNTRELKMAAIDIGGGGFDDKIAVRAFSGGSFTGPAHPDSRMNIAGDRSAHAAIRIMPRLVFDHVSGVYDLTATITSFDPAWGDLAGAFYSAVVTLSQVPPGAREFGGTFADWRFTDPDGESDLVAFGSPAVPPGTGSIRGFFTPREEVIIEVGQHWHMVGRVLDSGHIAGTFGWCCGHISGTFTARRRQWE